MLVIMALFHLGIHFGDGVFLLHNTNIMLMFLQVRTIQLKIVRIRISMVNHVLARLNAWPSVIWRIYR